MAVDEYGFEEEPSQAGGPPVLDEYGFEKEPSQAGGPPMLDEYGFEKEPSQAAESIPIHLARSLAHEALPFAGGIAGAESLAPYGVMAGTAIGGPVGGIIGGLGAGLAGALGGGAVASYLQEKGAKFLGFDDDAIRTANAQANPITERVARVLPMAAAFSPYGASRLMRGAGALVGGGLETGRQVASGEYNPVDIATEAAAGGIFARPRWGGSARERLFSGEQVPVTPVKSPEIGGQTPQTSPSAEELNARAEWARARGQVGAADFFERAAQTIPTEPTQASPEAAHTASTQQHGTAGSPAAKGVAQPATPPTDILVSADEKGKPAVDVVRSAQYYPKVEEPLAPRAELAAQGKGDPDLNVALQATQEDFTLAEQHRLNKKAVETGQPFPFPETEAAKPGGAGRTQQQFPSARAEPLPLARAMPSEPGANPIVAPRAPSLPIEGEGIPDFLKAENRAVQPIEARVHAAYAEAGGTPRNPVTIAELRARLPDVPASQLDAELRRLHLQPGNTLSGSDYPAGETQATLQGGLSFKNVPMYRLWLGKPAARIEQSPGFTTEAMARQRGPGQTGRPMTIQGGVFQKTGGGAAAGAPGTPSGGMAAGAPGTPSGGMAGTPSPTLQPATAHDLKEGVIASLRRAFNPLRSPSAQIAANVLRESIGPVHRIKEQAMARISTELHRVANKMEVLYPAVLIQVDSD